MRSKSRHTSGLNAGFTLVEMVIVLGLVCVGAGVSVMMMPGAILTARADSGSARVVAAMRVAREQAIAQRRTIRVSFVAPDKIVFSRVEVPGPGTTEINTVLLEDGLIFKLFPGMPDTPDAFGNATPVSFGDATTISFTSEGSFVDQNGDPANGTAFLGRSDQPLSARAVSLFGPTAQIREWRWNGTQWTP